MKKKKLIPMTNQEKSAKRRHIMDCAAVNITGDNNMTWRKFETSIKKAYQQGNKIEITVHPL